MIDHAWTENAGSTNRPRVSGKAQNLHTSVVVGRSRQSIILGAKRCQGFWEGRQAVQALCDWDNTESSLQSEKRQVILESSRTGLWDPQGYALRWRRGECLSHCSRSCTTRTECLVSAV